MMRVDDLVTIWADVERARRCVIRHLCESPGSSTSEIRHGLRPDRVGAGLCSAALRTLAADGRIGFAPGARGARLWRLIACQTNCETPAGIEGLPDDSTPSEGKYDEIHGEHVG